MAEPGLKAYALRDPKRTGIYAFENKPQEFSPEYEEISRKQSCVGFFQRPPSIRKVCTFWVMTAKKEETRLRRLEDLIASSAKGVRRGVMETKSKQP